MKRYKQYVRHFNPFESSAARRAMRRRVKKCRNPTNNDVMPISSENCQEYCEKDLEVSFDSFMTNSTDLSADLDGSSVSSFVIYQNDERNSYEKDTRWFSSEQETKETPCEELEDMQNDGTTGEDVIEQFPTFDRFVKDDDNVSDDSSNHSSDLDGTESDNESLEDACSQSDNDLLYSDAPITTTSSVVLLLSFASKHKLTREAFNDLLVVIEAHCPQPNNCKTTVRKLLDFVSQAKGEIVRHYFCEYCKAYHGRRKVELGGNCNICQKELSTTCGYFIEVPIVKQLQNFFGGEHLTFTISSVYSNMISQAHDMKLSLLWKKLRLIRSNRALDFFFRLLYNCLSSNDHSLEIE